MAQHSSLRLWQEQILQHLKTGRLRYLQRIAVVCAALEPHTLDDLLLPPHPPPSPSPPTLLYPSQLQQPPPKPPIVSTSSVDQASVVHRHGRLYIPNPFLLPTLHCCVVCVRRRSLTLKRILAALGAGDLSPLLERDDIPRDVPLVPFLLSCVYIHLVQVKGNAAIEIEKILQTAAQSESLAKYSYSTPPVTYTALITAVINRTLRFTEPAFSESPLSPFETSPLSLYFNELFETTHLERWTTMHNAKALMESIQGAVDKSITIELRLGKDQKLPTVTSQEAWAEHISTCFDLVAEYQHRSPSIVITQLGHLYQLHHSASLRNGPRGYLAWWENESTHRLSLLIMILQHATKDSRNTNNMEIIKFTLLLLVGWVNQQQPHELVQLQRRRQNRGQASHRDTHLLVDEEVARLIVEATELTKVVLAMKDVNFAPSLVFLFLSVGVLLPFSELLGRGAFKYAIGLLQDDSWADFITSHPRLSDIMLPFAELLAALRAPLDLCVATKAILLLWHSVLPTFNDALLIHTVCKVAASNVAQSALTTRELETWYSAVSTTIQEFFGAPHNDSVHFTCLYAASGVLKGLPSTVHPHAHELLQEVLVNALHRLSACDEEASDLWRSAVAFALAHSGLCSKNTTLDVDHDVPKALELLVKVIVSDVFGGWIFGVPPFSSGHPSSIDQPGICHPNSHNATGLDIHLTPIRAHAHAKTALYASSSAFTSSIARLFTMLPLGHPSRNTTIFHLWSYAKVVYESWREFVHRKEANYTDSSVVTASLLPIVQVAQLAVTLFCFYASQASSPSPQKSTSLSDVAAESPSNLPPGELSTIIGAQKTSGMSPGHAVDAIDALGYLEFAGADVPRFHSKLANLFLFDPQTLEQNVKELIYRIPIPVSAYASFQPSRDQLSVSPSSPLPPTKDGKALLARVAFLLRVIEPLAPLVDVDTLTNRLIPVTFAMLSHASEQVRRSAHAVIHSLLALAPVPLAQSLVPSYCRIALASALKDDVPVPSASNNAPIADYLYESMAAIFRRMSPPVALVAVRALASAAMNAVVSSSDGIQHKKLILLLLAQTVVQVDISILDITLTEISKIVHMATTQYKYTLLSFLHRVVTRNVDYTRKTLLASWFLLQARDAKLED